MVVRNALTQLQARAHENGKFADGQGLWLCKSRKDAGKWMLRLSINGKRREMGLGRWPDVSIAEARERASAARRKLRDGLDPIEERAKHRKRTKRLTVSEAVNKCFVARQAELKGDGKAGRWMSPLQLHIIPKIGKLAVEDLDQHEIKKVLDPIWHTKADTARKALNRINLTLKHAAALGLNVDLQATMKARALLGKQRYVPKHIPSLPYQDAPAFYKWLCTKELTSVFALRLLMLTLARTSEIRLATFDEFAADIWIIPETRTKTGVEHKIPLAPVAQKIVTSCRQTIGQELLFPSPTGKPMSDATMSRFMEREGYVARPHGFRATFRTWVEEQTDTPFEIKEAVLGHTVDSDVVRAYQRSDRLEKRRKLMTEWSTFLLHDVP